MTIHTYILELSNELDVMTDTYLNEYMDGDWELVKIVQVPEAKKMLFMFIAKKGKER